MWRAALHVVRWKVSRWLPQIAECALLFCDEVLDRARFRGTRILFCPVVIQAQDRWFAAPRLPSPKAFPANWKPGGSPNE